MVRLDPYNIILLYRCGDVSTHIVPIEWGLIFLSIYSFKTALLRFWKGVLLNGSLNELLYT